MRWVAKRPRLMFAYSGTLSSGSPPKASVRLIPAFTACTTDTPLRRVLTAVASAKSRLSRRSSRPSMAVTSASSAMGEPLREATASATSLTTSPVCSPAVSSTSAESPAESRMRAQVHSVRSVATTEANSTRSRCTGSVVTGTNSYTGGRGTASSMQLNWGPWGLSPMRWLVCPWLHAGLPVTHLQPPRFLLPYLYRTSLRRSSDAVH